MLEAFIIVLREGFESFLIISLTAAYLYKTNREDLLGALHWGVAVSLFLSVGFGYLMMLTANEPLFEAWMGLISGVLILGFVIHMWRSAPTLGQEMRDKISAATQKRAFKAHLGIFVFTTVMITREGMETAMLLMQVRSQEVWSGAFLGLIAAIMMAMLWNRLSRYIDLKAFLRVTAVFLILFVCQIFIHTFHEFTETGLIANSEFWHEASEAYSSEGIYGRWLSPIMVVVCGVWLLVAAITKKSSLAKNQ